MWVCWPQSCGGGLNYRGKTQNSAKQEWKPRQKTLEGPQSDQGPSQQALQPMSFSSEKPHAGRPEEYVDLFFSPFHLNAEDGV